MNEITEQLETCAFCGQPVGKNEGHLHETDALNCRGRAYKALWLVTVDRDECRSTWDCEPSNLDEPWGLSDRGTVLTLAEDSDEARMLAEEYANEERGARYARIDGENVFFVDADWP